MQSRLAAAAAIGLTLAIGCSDRQPAAPRAGGSPYGPTRPNDAPAPGQAPPGMVWIPGGEFSMGSRRVGAPVTAAATDVRRRPIHRVYVDGFWMDATEVTNEQFAKFVEGDRLRHGRREERRRARTFPTAPAGEPGRRLGRLHAPAGARARSTITTVGGAT